MSCIKRLIRRLSSWKTEKTRILYNFLQDRVLYFKRYTTNINTSSMPSSEEACLKGSLPEWKVLILGQMISLCYFGGSALTSGLEHDFGFRAPNFIAFSIAAGLSLFLIPLYFSRISKRKNSHEEKEIVYKSYLFSLIPLHACWKSYALVGLVDYSATLCCNLALQFTTLTSYIILRSLVTPAAMMFSKCFLRRKYRIHTFDWSFALYNRSRLECFSRPSRRQRRQGWSKWRHEV